MNLNKFIAIFLLGGIYKISEWSDMVTVHALPGPDMVKQFFVDPDVKKNCGCVLVLEMSTAGALTTADYTKGIFHCQHNFLRHLYTIDIFFYYFRCISTGNRLSRSSFRVCRSMSSYK